MHTHFSFTVLNERSIVIQFRARNKHKFEGKRKLEKQREEKSRRKKSLYTIYALARQFSLFKGINSFCGAKIIIFLAESAQKIEELKKCAAHIVLLFSVSISFNKISVSKNFEAKTITFERVNDCLFMLLCAFMILANGHTR